MPVVAISWEPGRLDELAMKVNVKTCIMSVPKAKGEVRWTKWWPWTWVSRLTDWLTDWWFTDPCSLTGSHWSMLYWPVLYCWGFLVLLSSVMPVCRIWLSTNTMNWYYNPNFTIWFLITENWATATLYISCGRDGLRVDGSVPVAQALQGSDRKRKQCQLCQCQGPVISPVVLLT